MIKRLLIANRGEIAVRMICARAASWASKRGGVLGRRRATRRMSWPPTARSRIGPAPRRRELSVDAADHRRGAERPAPTRFTRATASCPRTPAFAAACERAGLVFVGPPASVIAQMGSKIDARRLMERAGVPVVPGETPDDQSDAGLRRAVDSVGFPALDQSIGGRRRQRDARGRATAAAMRRPIQAARREATAAFGDGTLYVERLIERPHHIEVQIFADAHGRVVHLFERECSVQRRHQKIIEESPSPH